MKKGFLATLFNVVLFRHVTRLFYFLWPRNPENGETEEISQPRVHWLSRCKAWLQSCQQWWQDCAQFWKHVIINLAVGLIIAIVLHELHHFEFPTLTAMEDAAMDFVMRHFSNVGLGGEGNAFVLLDVDQQSYQAWEEPFYIHRDKLQKLIEYARSGHPVMIIVDVDVSKEGDPEAARELAGYLKQYDTGDNPPLILVRTMKSLPPEVPHGFPPSQRASFLDSAVSGDGSVFWASPHYKRDSDYRVRRWFLWYPACTDGKPEVLVSIELLTKALLAGKDKASPAGIRARLKQCLAGIRYSCDPDAYGDQDSASTLKTENESCQVGRHEISLHPSLTGQRLIYTIPFDIPEGVKRPTVDVNGKSVPMFERWSAHRITGSDVRLDLQGRVVVIGGSFRESRDWHATPLGEMPGVMVIINAINSLGLHGQLAPPPLWLKLVIEAILILIMSLLFAWFSSFTGMLLSGLAVILLLVPASFLAFRSGVWVDFALPLLAVQLHQMARELEESREGTHERQKAG